MWKISFHKNRKSTYVVYLACNIIASSESEIRPRRDSEWMDDDDDYDFGSDHRENENLREPPPPARPDDFRTCSPSPAARSPTPAVSSSTIKLSSKMPRTESQTLVGYGGPNEENIDDGTKKREKRRSKDEKPQHISVSNLKAETGSDRTEESSDVITADNSPTTTTAAADDLDPYSLLDKCLEKDSNEIVAVDSPDQTSSPSNGNQSSQMIALPPEPTEKCSPALEKRFVDFFVKKFRYNYDFNKQIQQRKDFRNPSIYEKLIEHFNLDELGSNFDPEIFNPRGFKSSDYYDEIAKAQSVLMSKTEKEKTNAKDGGAASTDDSKKRKSKWDNPDKAKLKN
uniref:SAP30-binding protein n=1 Tax=Romanomermis culicivorax TaxID=13658 RepID=A0A915KJP0_ROMCU